MCVTGVMDMRSTKVVVDVRRTENWVGILAGLRKWYGPHGLPAHVTMDRGKAYEKAARTHGRKSPQRHKEHREDGYNKPARIHGRKSWKRSGVDTAKLGSVFMRFKIEVHHAIAYHPWAKKIESIWRLIKKHCDRWLASFWGGCPAERSYVAEELVKHHVEELPTEEEFRQCVLTAVETYNATPRRALGDLSPNEMFERFRGTVRRCDPDVFDTYFTIAEGPRRVGRDGVRYNNILYTLEAEDLVALQGKDVWVLPRLDAVGKIALCDQHENLLAYAVQQQLVRAGAKDEHARAAFAKKGRVRKLAKAYLAERDFLLDTPTGQILREKHAFAQAEEAERRKGMALSPAPDLAVVRGDLAEQAGKVRRPIVRRVTGALAADTGATGSVAESLGLLADRNEGVLAPRRPGAEQRERIAVDELEETSREREQSPWRELDEDGRLIAEAG